MLVIMLMYTTVKHKNKKRRSGHLNFKFTKSVEGNISTKKIL